MTSRLRGFQPRIFILAKYDYVSMCDVRVFFVSRSTGPTRLTQHSRLNGHRASRIQDKIAGCKPEYQRVDSKIWNDTYQAMQRRRCNPDCIICECILAQICSSGTIAGMDLSPRSNCMPLAVRRLSGGRGCVHCRTRGKGAKPRKPRRGYPCPGLCKRGLLAESRGKILRSSLVILILGRRGMLRCYCRAAVGAECLSGLSPVSGYYRRRRVGIIALPVRNAKERVLHLRRRAPQ